MEFGTGIRIIIGGYLPAIITHNAYRNEAKSHETLRGVDYVPDLRRAAKRAAMAGQEKCKR